MKRLILAIAVVALVVAVDAPDVQAGPIRNAFARISQRRAERAGGQSQTGAVVPSSCGSCQQANSQAAAVRSGGCASGNCPLFGR